jgi:hypothetical protein
MTITSKSTTFSDKSVYLCGVKIYGPVGGTQQVPINYTSCIANDGGASNMLDKTPGKIWATSHCCNCPGIELCLNMRKCYAITKFKFK